MNYEWNYENYEIKIIWNQEWKRKQSLKIFTSPNCSAVIKLGPSIKDTLSIKLIYN